MLDTLGQLSFTLERTERTARFLKPQFELCDRLRYPVHSRLLLFDRLDVDTYVVQLVQDELRLVFDIVEKLSARVLGPGMSPPPAAAVP